VSNELPARIVTLAAVILLQAASSRAQTDDPVFAQWRFSPEPLGSRPAGLGGAFVAVADDVKAAAANPAGIALLPAREANASSLRSWAGLGGGWRRRLRFAVYGWDAGAQTLSRLPRSQAEGGPRLTPLEGAGGRTSSLTEFGAAVATTPVRGLHIGVSGAWTRMRWRGDGAAAAADSPASLASSRVRWSAGMLLDLLRGRWRPLSSLRLGLSIQPGIDWDLHGGDVAGGASFALRRPTVAAVGLAWRPAPHWLVSVEADQIRYREVVSALRRNVGARADGFALSDRVEPHAGIEFAAPLSCGCGNIRLRAGVRGRSPGRLHYSGNDPERREAFPGEPWRAAASLGVSFVGEYLDRAVRLDLDSADLFDGPRLTVGATFRF
jgi:hypothetical protein